jgi:hypothetical protein
MFILVNPSSNEAFIPTWALKRGTSDDEKVLVMG